MKKRPESDSITGFTGLSRIELTGNRKCIIDGLKGIREYHRDRICMDLGKYSVCFLGDELYINCFSPEGAVIEGTIIALEFESNA